MLWNSKELNKISELEAEIRSLKYNMKKDAQELLAQWIKTKTEGKEYFKLIQENEYLKGKIEGLTPSYNSRSRIL